jgi:hypothetical protein
MKGVLCWLVRRVCRADKRDFCSALAALVGPVQNTFFLTIQLLQCVCPNCPASWVACLSVCDFDLDNRWYKNHLHHVTGIRRLFLFFCAMLVRLMSQKFCKKTEHISRLASTYFRKSVATMIDHFWFM